MQCLNMINGIKENIFLFLFFSPGISHFGSLYTVMLCALGSVLLTLL